MLLNLRKKKEAYDQLMEKLQREVKGVDMRHQVHGLVGYGLTIGFCEDGKAGARASRTAAQER